MYLDGTFFLGGGGVGWGLCCCRREDMFKRKEIQELGSFSRHSKCLGGW